MVGAASRGDEEAAFWVGVMHYRGRGGPPDFTQAERYLKLATDLGHRRAMLHLGSLYRDWPRLPHKHELARHYWEKASHLGSPQATHNLGQYYETGSSGAVDLDRACYYYERGSEMGHRDSWQRYTSLCWDIPTGTLERDWSERRQ